METNLSVTTKIDQMASLPSTTQGRRIVSLPHTGYVLAVIPGFATLNICQKLEYEIPDTFDANMHSCSTYVTISPRAYMDVGCDFKVTAD